MTEQELFESRLEGSADLRWVAEVGQYNSTITQKMWMTWQAARQQDEADFQKVIEERDSWEEKATELAEAVGKHFGIDVGEHTSANCPVQKAISALDLYEIVGAPDSKKQPESYVLVEKGFTPERVVQAGERCLKVLLSRNCFDFRTIASAVFEDMLIASKPPRSESRESVK